MIEINLEEGLKGVLKAIKQRNLGYYKDKHTNLMYHDKQQGCVCAIGAMIPSDVSTKDIEGKMIAHLIDDGTIKFTKKSHGKIAIELQDTHDRLVEDDYEEDKHRQEAIDKFEQRIKTLSKRVRG